MQKNVGERWFVCKLGTSLTVATIAHLKSLVHIMIMPRRVVAIVVSSSISTTFSVEEAVVCSTVISFEFKNVNLPN
jgi:uncharacterized membrane protein YecN with MAPEG domain